MGTKILVVAAGLGLLLSAWAGRSPARVTVQESPDVTQGEDFLRAASVVEVDKEAIGRTAGWKVRLDDGKHKGQAVFKYVNRRRPTLVADSYHYELAAYALSTLLGLGVVPSTVEREVEGLKGSLQCYCTDVFSETTRRRKNLEPPDPQKFQDRLADIAVLENLAYTSRTDLNDLLIQNTDWKVWRVDFSEAFKPEPRLLAGSVIERCSKALWEALKSLGEEKIREVLGPHLNEREIAALLARKALVLETIKKAIQDRGESAVLFER